MQLTAACIQSLFNRCAELGRYAAVGLMRLSSLVLALILISDRNEYNYSLLLFCG